MPGPILHVGAVVMCSHGGMAIPTVPRPFVTSVGHAGCHDRCAIRDRRLCVRSACGKRALRDGAVDRRVVVCHFKWPAPGDLEWSFNVYTDGHSDGSGVRADFCDRFVVKAQHELLKGAMR